MLLKSRKSRTVGTVVYTARKLSLSVLLSTFESSLFVALNSPANYYSQLLNDRVIKSSAIVSRQQRLAARYSRGSTTHSGLHSTSRYRFRGISAIAARTSYSCSDNIVIRSVAEQIALANRREHRARWWTGGDGGGRGF